MNNENYYTEGIHPNKNLEKPILSTAIIVIKLNRTSNGVCFKIRKLKQKVLSAVDDEKQNFSVTAE
jgi:hypothetical protein